MTPPLRVLMISSEVGSFARTGGLGDMVEGLARSLVAEGGAEVTVVTPLYGFGVTTLPHDTTRWTEPIRLEDGRNIGVLETSIASGAGHVRVLLIDAPRLFDRRGVYADEYGLFGDNALRFATMSRAALAIGERIWGASEAPIVLHAHDWHAGLTPLLAKRHPSRAIRNARHVFSIHNLAYQGIFETSEASLLGIETDVASGEALFDGKINFLKAALVSTDRITTVSQTYAREILTEPNGCGLQHILSTRQDRLSGIVNGIDTEMFDPSRDPLLAAPFDAATAHDQRPLCKAAIARIMGLDMSGNPPLFASVSRLTWQKGVDSVVAASDEIVSRGGRVLFVGGGDQDLTDAIAHLVGRHPGRVASRTVFDGNLARRTYAGADFVLMPSRYEPCGLTQLYAMRYGAIPIVTPVGGLADTVVPLADRAQGTGIVAASHEVADVQVAVRTALDLYGDTDAMRTVIARAMKHDSSWTEPARAYVNLYRTITAQGG